MTSFFKLLAINGSNPLGFLSALGALRLAALRFPDAAPTLGWKQDQYWVPILSGVPVDNEQSLCTALLEAPSAPIGQFSVLGKNITVSPDSFRNFASQSAQNGLPADRRLADFATAFGCEDCVDDKNDRIRYTQLCFITGSGHQDFLGTIAALKDTVAETHIHEALFSGWQGKNKGLAFRWDPIDAREYALRWSDPSKEGAWTTWGANRLAFEALPFFPTQPSDRRLATTGFTTHRRRGEPRRDEFTWPIWTEPIEADQIRSLLSLGELQKENPSHEQLHARGIGEIFRATRIRIGQGANFKVSFRPARAV